MDKPNLELLARRVISDPVFRSQFLADPERAVNEAGWDLPPQEMAALKAWHANLRDVTKLEELELALSALIAAQAEKRG